MTSRPDPYAVAGTDASTRMYACPNIASNVTIVRADRSTPGFMRAPAETPYFFALESAMDELAVALDMDPVELRRVNDTMKEPIKGLPYTSRSLMPCFDQAAEAFGWSKRDAAAGLDARRRLAGRLGLRHLGLSDPDGAGRAPASRLFPDGTARVETASHEIGNGIYTVVGADRGRAARPAVREGRGRARRHRPAAGAGRGRLDLDRERLLGRGPGLRRHPGAG